MAPHRVKARAGGRGAKESKRGGAVKPPLKERARSFAFEGVPEKDRFGVFDPGVRGMYIFGFMLAAVIAVGGVFDAWGSAPVAYGLAAVIGFALLAAGVAGYRTIWKSPGEREILLAMAREDDEARQLRSQLPRERAERNARAAERAKAPGQPAEVDRSGDEPRKAF